MAENKSSGVIAWVVLAVIIIIGAVYFLRPASTPTQQPVANETNTPEVITAQIPDGPIIMGASAPLSGDQVAFATMRTATDLAVEEINANGGVKGHQLQIIWEDDKCNPQDGTSAAQKLVEVDKVHFIIGTVCSGATLAEAAITEPAKVLLFSAAASSPDLTTAGDYVFRTYPSDGVGGKVLAKYSYNELKKMKLAMLSEQVDYTQGLRKTMSETFKALGGEVVADENYNAGDTDFRTQLLKMKESGADIVFVNANGPVPGTLILKQMNVAGLKVLTVVNDSLISADAISKNRGLYEGVYSTSPDLDPARPQTKKYL
ncbi:MAG: ABC transporter substrate-binding protein, partial [Patescibacteria group bacterium]